jgi:hypothetical protein
MIWTRYSHVLSRSPETVSGCGFRVGFGFVVVIVGVGDG